MKIVIAVNENQAASPIKVLSSDLRCDTGMVYIELESGVTVHDDTHSKSCGFGQNSCYKTTFTATFGNWPGNL